MKACSRFNQYTGPQESAEQQAWRREAYYKLDKIARKWAKGKDRA